MVGVPGIGKLAQGIYDLAVGIFKRIRDRDNPSQEELDRLREAEIRAREEYLKKLEAAFDLEFDVLRDMWERNQISTQEFIDEVEELNEEMGRARTPWRYPIDGLGDWPYMEGYAGTADPSPVSTGNVYNITVEGSILRQEELGVTVHESLRLAFERGLIARGVA
jgi:hypothetical protein